ncbi:MAG: PLD nuclease N-terminal domain-containing protein [Microthrixaceae bacterium]
MSAQPHGRESSSCRCSRWSSPSWRRDFRKRPAAEVKGPKFLWLLALAVQPVGPLAYLAVGRRRNGA